MSFKECYIYFFGFRLLPNLMTNFLSFTVTKFSTYALKFKTPFTNKCYRHNNNKTLSISVSIFIKIDGLTFVKSVFMIDLADFSVYSGYYFKKVE